VRLQVAAEPLLLRPQVAAELPAPVQRQVAAERRVRARRPVDAAVSEDSAAVDLLSHQSFSAAMARSTT
jgi:hypothetical protein